MSSSPLKNEELFNLGDSYNAVLTGKINDDDDEDLIAWETKCVTSSTVTDGTISYTVTSENDIDLTDCFIQSDGKYWLPMSVGFSEDETPVAPTFKTTKVTLGSTEITTPLTLSSSAFIIMTEDGYSTVLVDMTNIIEQLAADDNISNYTSMLIEFEGIYNNDTKYGVVTGDIIPKISVEAVIT